MKSYNTEIFITDSKGNRLDTITVGLHHLDFLYEDLEVKITIDNNNLNLDIPTLTKDWSDGFEPSCEEKDNICDEVYNHIITIGELGDYNFNICEQ